MKNDPKEKRPSTATGAKKAAKPAAKPAAKKAAGEKTVKKEAAPKPGTAGKGGAKKSAAKGAASEKPAEGKAGPAGKAEAKPEAKAEARAEAKTDAGQRAKTPYMPQPTFSTFVLSLASSAMVQLGEVPHPETGETGLDLNLAKHTIDTIAMLREKTKGNLSPDENRLVEGLLYELRMKFVMKK